MMSEPTHAPLLQLLLEAAERHGRDSEPDHEVGDLQDLCWELWRELAPVRQLRVVARMLRDEDSNLAHFGDTDAVTAYLAQHGVTPVVFEPVENASDEDDAGCACGLNCSRAPDDPCPLGEDVAALSWSGVKAL